MGKYSKAKRFTKEWWLNIATTVIRDFELCSFDNGISHITFRQTYDWDDEDLDLFTNYCFKRYAEAYHREKMDLITKVLKQRPENQRNLGIAEGEVLERERILGIIAIEIGSIEGMNYEEDNYEAGKVHALEELIEKIQVK